MVTDQRFITIEPRDEPMGFAAENDAVVLTGSLQEDPVTEIIPAVTGKYLVNDSFD